MGLTLVVANVRALGGRLQLANRSTPGVTVLIQVPPPSGTPSGGTASERIRRRRG
jgi:sensor histidine kinase regulating citrate/malate metabolism